VEFDLKRYEATQTHDFESGVGENRSMHVAGDALKHGVVVSTLHCSVDHPVAFHSASRVEIGCQQPFTHS